MRLPCHRRMYVLIDNGEKAQELGGIKQFEKWNAEKILVSFLIDQT